MLNDIDISKNDLYSLHQVPENGIDSVKTSYGLSYNEPCISSNILLCCSICKFHCNQSCYGSLFGNFIKNNFLKQCPKCGINEYVENDQNMEKNFQKSPTYRFYNQVKSTDYSTFNSNERKEVKSDILEDCFFNNKLYPSMNNSRKNIQDFVYHSKDMNSDAYLRKNISKNTFSDCPKNILYYDNPILNQDDIVKCDIKDIVNEKQLNDELLHKQCLNDIDIDPIDLEGDQDSCIDVEDSGYELQVGKQKKIYLTASKRRGSPKRKPVIKTSASSKPSKFKEITNNIAVSYVLKPFRNKKRFLKKHGYIRSSNSPKKYIKNIKECSDSLISKKKTTNFINPSQVLDLHDKSKRLSRKRRRYQDTDEHSLNDMTQSREFPHLFGPAPRLPVEIKDGQRLGKKYRRRYNICDLTYVHVHRQISTPKTPFYDVNEDKNKDDPSFDILNLIPREMVPVVTSNSQLGFREAIIDKRLMRYKRGVPIFRVGRKVPGELS
ncbi:hypothetical protein PNEG_02471 [Pneumocystis murina B123]|uniref:Uncharacterized protein n=1 Tax=Pneumocystis murina (strain B123) TaxID=1069680 RepID=M7NKG1_PNEMU|nr:hypothetical protein PNEG_02471 [Pneumocystis murina B123]EMR09128.1 hypothetical protein PNEG_02471 [Pneumocystis murina B123]